MQGQGNNIKKKQQESTFQRIERMHPHKMLLYLAIIGSSLIFLFMVIAYSISKPQNGFLEDFVMPKAFIFSTIILIFSGFISTRLETYYNEDKIRSLKGALGITLFLGICFAVSQYIGWGALNASGIYLSGKASGSFLYVLTGLHVVHLVGGLLFLTYLFINTIWASKDPIRTLIMVTNPYEKIKLQIFAIYWQFLDVLWLALFFYFLFAL